MVVKHCCYGICRSDSRYVNKDHMKGVTFIPFPNPNKDLDRCRRWVRACGRENFEVEKVTKDTFICTLHFVGGYGPSEQHPDPMPATLTPIQIRRYCNKRKPPKERDINRSTKKQLKLDTQDVAQALLDLACSPVMLLADVDPPRQLDTIPLMTSSHDDDSTYDSVIVSEMPCTQDVGCQTTMSRDTHNVCSRIENKLLQNENKLLKSELHLLQPSTSSREIEISEKIQQHICHIHFDISEVEDNDQKCKFYTGLSWVQLMTLWSFISPAVEHLKYWYSKGSKLKVSSSVNCHLSSKNALLMTLMFLKLGLVNQDLAYRFGVSKATVSNIITTWVQILYTQFLPLKDFMFAERCRVKEKMPRSFKKYKNLRCIIDCTEFFVQRSSNLQSQGNLYSSYKAHSTYKVLIAVIPNGAIMYVSSVFEGSISDKEIVLKSGFLKYLNPGDVVMADQGFNIKNIFNEIQVELIIPPFLRDRKVFTAQEEALTKDVAKHRIHVERAIERVKSFHLLHKTMPLSLEPIITQIVYVVCCLVNFQEPLCQMSICQ